MKNNIPNIKTEVCEEALWVVVMFKKDISANKKK
jgi:hypothetical protein